MTATAQAPSPEDVARAVVAFQRTGELPAGDDRLLAAVLAAVDIEFGSDRADSRGGSFRRPDGIPAEAERA